MSERMRAYIETEPDLCAVGWSGGKDSTVVLHMAYQINPRIKAVFCNTRNEYPESVKYIHDFTKEFNINLIEVFPKDGLTPLSIFKKYGVPPSTRKGDPVCCRLLKMIPGNKAYRNLGAKYVFTGIRTEESRQRLISIMHYGYDHYCKSYGNRRIHPIHDWTFQDVYNYLKIHKIKINPAYERYKIDRLGCRFCPAYRTWIKNLSRIDPLAYRVIQKLRGQTLLE